VGRVPPGHFPLPPPPSPQTPHSSPPTPVEHLGGRGRGEGETACPPAFRGRPPGVQGDPSHETQALGNHNPWRPTTPAAPQTHPGQHLQASLRDPCAPQTSPTPNGKTALQAAIAALRTVSSPDREAA
jgi:hypothetical protein